MKSEILLYNRHDISWERSVMPKLKVQIDTKKSFGERMARLRYVGGYSQRDLARETGVSHRMIAYYEKQAEYPPTHVLPILAKALGVSVDQLLGLEKIKTNGKNKDMRLWRRFNQVEKLEAKEKRQVLQLLGTFIERDQLKRKTGT